MLPKLRGEENLAYIGHIVALLLLLLLQHTVSYLLMHFAHYHKAHGFKNKK